MKSLDDILAEQETATVPVTTPVQAASVNAGAKTSPTAFDLDESIARNAALHGIPIGMAKAMIKQESGGKQSAVSHKGATGITQLMPDTAKYLGVDINDPEQNVEGGLRYLSEQMKEFQDPALALAAYNAGPGAVKKHGGIPPFKETQNYVKSILGKMGQYDQEEQAPKKLTVGGERDVLSLDDILAQAEPEAAPAEATPEDILLGNQPVMPVEQPMVQEAGMLPAPSTGLAGQALAGSQSFLDALGVGSLERGIAKVPGALEASEIINNLLHGDEMPIEQRAQQVQGITQQAQAEHPFVSGAGTVAGVAGQAVALNPVFKAAGALLGGAKAAPALAQAGKLLEGGVSSAVQEATTNKDVTGKDLVKAGLIGTATAGAFQMGAKALKFGGEQGLKFSQNLKLKSKVPQYIAKELKMSLTQGGLAEKNIAKMDEYGTALQNTLKQADKAGKTVDLADLITKDDVLEIAVRKYQAGLRKEGDTLLDLARNIEKGKGSVKPTDANKLKRLFWDEARFKTSGDPGTAERAQAAYQRGRYLKNALETATEDLPIGKQVKTLNGKLQMGIELRDAIEAQGNKKVTSPSNLVKAGMAATAGGAALAGNLPILAATTLGTTAGGQAAAKAGQALSEQDIIRNAVSTLLGKM